MSWFPERRTQDSWVHKICTSVLKAGPIPQHIAIIMDGNRRFAKKNSMAKAEGHLKGFDKLAETLEWCLSLGILEVTVYAFSIENFKRSKDEVDCLMELARQKFARLLEEKELIQKHEVCVRVLGNVSLLPEDVQRTVAEVINLSKNNTRATLNVCFSYTSRDEICTAVKEMAEGVESGEILESDISEEMLERCLYTNRSRHPDLLIRTSGEVRLSDFLLWQSTFSVLSFLEVLWPDFSIWHLYAAVLHYQRNYTAVNNAIEENDQEKKRLQAESDRQCVLQEEKCKKCDTESCNHGNCPHSNDLKQLTFQEKVEQYSQARQKRVDNFCNNLQNRRDMFFQDLNVKQKS
ncbi:dehydrodolichyl diphosphate synthase complex subunit DHDDS-like [Ruditapes philippinarum]|uniref:dehydrodolichyl diphosphate synthase complex subunit DHDDS-like n=1 Tax=Ruditapes philippinarum TaxID=129788 RepID=UPI00295B95AF|nr:dehydrodolichyl diphosphate synthase complex subunit DHDDS-like [Ruditapes philippinarum]